jgi:acyl-CoA thioester hydrolase
MSEKKLLNSVLITLRWTDMDAYSHLGNSRFFDFMTDARVDAFKELDIIKDLSKQYVIVDAQCSFKTPAYYPGKIRVQQYCEKVGNSSFTLSYIFSMENEPDVICAEGRAVMVCFDAKLKTAVRIPEALRALLAE